MVTRNGHEMRWLVTESRRAWIRFELLTLEGARKVEPLRASISAAVMCGWRGCRFGGRRGICLPLNRVEAVYPVKTLEFSADRRVEVECVRTDDVVGGL